MAALGSDPGSGSADLPGLGFISFRLMKDNLTDATVFIREELERERSDARKIKSLNECLQLYREAADDAEDGTRALAAKNYQRMSIDALAVGSAAEGCDRAFAGPAAGDPLALCDLNLNRLSEIAWVIAIMLR